MQAIKWFIIKWFIIISLIFGGSFYFLKSNLLNDYGFVKSSKDSVNNILSSFYEEKKHDLIKNTLDKIGYADQKIDVNIKSDIESMKSPVVNNEEKKKEEVKEVFDNSKKPLANTDFSPLKMTFYYDASNAPKNVDQENLLSLVGQASNSWTEACNVSFEFKGNRATDYVDQNNTLPGKTGLIKWGSLDGDAIGQAHQGNSHGPAYGFVLTLKPSFFKDERNIKFLYSTVLHELGHVIGLDHSKNANSIMFFQQLNRKQVLNDNDKKMCQYYRSRWSGLSAEKSSEKYGVLVNENITEESYEEN